MIAVSATRAVFRRPGGRGILAFMPVLQRTASRGGHAGCLARMDTAG